MVPDVDVNLLLAAKVDKLILSKDPSVELLICVADADFILLLFMTYYSVVTAVSSFNFYRFLTSDIFLSAFTIDSNLVDILGCLETTFSI